ncbi:MAG: MATE family efflux transporter [Saprospiraceae bacterium]|nr:MATE family efflux transporter [Saprospiraceae bacterium]
MAQLTSLKVDTSVKGIIALTLPISMAKLIPELNYLFNAAFLGQLGNVELALAGITGVYYLIFAAIGYGLNNALLAIMSRRAGEDNRSQIFSTLWHGLIIAFFLATIFVILTGILLKPILVMSDIEPESIGMITSYLNIRMLGLFFLYAMQMQNAYIISLQKSKYLIIVAVIESFANLVLDYGLIFGHFGLPELGFNGAAYASVISEIIGMLTVFLIIRYYRLSQINGIIHDWKIKWKTFRLVWTQGFPLMSQYAISTMAWWIFFLLVSRNYNYNEQAVSQVMRNLFGLSGVFSWAFGSSTNTIISNLIGQGKVSQIFPTLNKILKICVSGMLIFVVFINIFPTLFLSVFGQDDAFIQLGIGPLRIVSIAMLILCVGVVWLNAVVATGKTKVVFFIEFVGIMSYLSYIWLTIEVFKLGLNIAWMSEWVYWSVLFSLSFWYLRKGDWRIIEKY